MWIKNSCIFVLAGLVALFQINYPETATASKDIDVLPVNNSRMLHIDISSHRVKIGDSVEFTFSVTKDGYVSLWDIGTSGKVTRIYPNKNVEANKVYGADGKKSVKVEANKVYGAGGENSKFRFRVKEPLGMEDVYLIWTSTPEGQPTKAEFCSAGKFSKDLDVVGSMSPNKWAAAKVTFEIVGQEAASPSIPVSCQSVNVNGNVYILAMGANVEPLTKTNQDAENFVNGMKKFLNVRDRNIRLIKDAYKRDFKEGMEWLRQKAGPDDLVLIFFSGHGSTVKDDDGDEADGVDEGFVMYDAHGQSFARARYLVRDDEFAKWVNRISAKRIITFIDACHSGGLQKTFTGARIKFYINGELGVLPARIGSINKKFKTILGRKKDMAGGVDAGSDGNVKGLVFAAAKENQAALETAEGGLFVTCLMEALDRVKGKTGFNRIFEEARDMVIRKSNYKQTPVAVGNTNLGDNF